MEEEDEIISRVFLTRQYYQDKKKCCSSWESKLPKLCIHNQQGNRQIYTVVALLWGQFVSSWYSHITDDESFGLESLRVVSKLTLSLEERLIQSDLDMFVFQTVPCIFYNHFKDCHNAQDKARRSAGYKQDRDVFGELHIALSCDGGGGGGGGRPAALDHEQRYLRILISKVLDIVIEKQESLSRCEGALIQALIADLVLYNVVELLSDPFTVYDLITKICGDIERETSEIEKTTQQGIMELITCGDARKAVEIAFYDIKDKVNKARDIISFCWNCRGGSIDTKHHKYPLASDVVLRIIGEFWNLDNERPWLLSCLRLGVLPLTCSSPNGMVNSILSRVLYTRILTRTNIALIIREIRKLLYPDMSSGRMAVNPNINMTKQDKLDAIQQRKIDALNGLMAITPSWFVSSYTRNQFSTSLDWFADPLINKHLLYTLLDEIFATLLPQLLAPQCK